jgi:hypothetical protein
MTVSSYGSMRATDADRDQVHEVLRSAYAEGRLTWEEFDDRSSALLRAKTYGQLAGLTADLYRPASPAPYHALPVPAERANSLAVASLTSGLLQFPFMALAGIPAIVCGHLARHQIRRTGERGEGMATTGLVLGYAFTGIPLLTALIVVLLVVVLR